MTFRGDIIWSPTYRDQFMVLDSDMTLYKLDRYAVGDLHPITPSTLTHWVSNNATATRLCTNRDLSHHRCFDWHPRSSEFGQDLVAMGFANGRVFLTSPSISLSAKSISHVDVNENESSNTPSLIGPLRTHGNRIHEETTTVNGIPVLGKEFVPKHSRPCQSIRWNSHHTQWLAIGLERHRSDNGIFIWDVFSRSAPSFAPVPTSSESISASFSQQLHHQQLANSLSHQPHEISTLQQNQGIPIDHRRSHSGLSTSEGGILGNHFLQQSTTTMSVASGSSQQPQQYTRALYEFAGGESAHSVIWQSPKCLVCGLSGKYIRLYDTRDLSRSHCQITTKAVYGLTLDPFNDHRLCSYVDNQLFLWDLRHTEKPLLVVTDQKPYLKVQWDPVRRNVFTSLCKESSIVKVYHIQQIIAEETELSYTENHVQPSFISVDESPATSSPIPTLVNYDWHPQEECHLLCLNSHASISDFWVNERLCAMWSPDGGRLLTSFGKLIAELKNFHLTDDVTPTGDRDDDFQLQLDEDISLIMQRRALGGYGILGDTGASDDTRSLKQNADICSADGGLAVTPLVWTWTWMDKLKQFAELESAESWPYETNFPGVLHVLRMGVGAKSGCTSNVEYRSMAGLEAAAGHTAMFRVYTSPERDRILQFCGWGGIHAMSRERSFSIGGGGEAFLQDLFDSRQAERAAAIALFTLRLRMAVQILTRAASISEDKSHLQLTALALAGYPGAPSDREQSSGSTAVGVVSTPTPLTLNASSSTIQTSAVTSMVSATSLWVDQCNTILPKLANAYLKAMFQFLSCRATGGNNFEPLLESTDFPIHDKVAFAALFATDQRLEELLGSLTRQCIARGDLYGLLLTGLGSEQSIDLIQRYIDTTGDVQTGALLIIYGGGISNGGDATPNSVTSTTAASTTTGTMTRDNNAANRIIDGYFNLLDAWGLWHVRAQTNALYLKRSQNAGKITSQVYITCTYCARSIWAGAGGRMRQRMHKLGSCPSCKKPLPRCALCRLNVGVPLASDQDPSKPNKFASWFAWCQSCRHGGHAQHLSDWFAVNNECPVTGCSCKCASLDASSDFNQLLLALMKNDT